LTAATSTSTPGEEGIEIGEEVAVDAIKRSEATGNKVMPTREVEICTELLYDSHDPEQHAPRPSSVHLDVLPHPKAY